MDLHKRVAIVTGSARGLGKEYAEALLQRGARVVLVDILTEEGEATEQQFKEEYGDGNVKFMYGDVTKETIGDVLAKARDEFGGLDVLINNAGVLGDMIPSFEVNVYGTIRCCEFALSHMRIDKGGQGGVIINIGSIVGLRTHASPGIYAATKHAIVGYSCSLGKRLADENCGVCMLVLCPGCVRTELTSWAQYLDDTGDDATVDLLRNLGGWVDSSVVVGACMTLLERSVPSGTAVRADNTGVVIVDKDHPTVRPLEA